MKVITKCLWRRTILATFHDIVGKWLETGKDGTAGNENIVPKVRRHRAKQVYQFNESSAPLVNTSQFLLKPARPYWTKLSSPSLRLFFSFSGHIYFVSRLSSSILRALVLFASIEATLLWKTGTRFV